MTDDDIDLADYDTFAAVRAADRAPDRVAALTRLRQTYPFPATIDAAIRRARSGASPVERPVDVYEWLEDADARILEERAARADVDKALRILDETSPSVPPYPGDELIEAFGSGNVFEDLGFEDADERLARADVGERKPIGSHRLSLDGDESISTGIKR